MFYVRRLPHLVVVFIEESIPEIEDVARAWHGTVGAPHFRNSELHYSVGLLRCVQIPHLIFHLFFVCSHTHTYSLYRSNNSKLRCQTNEALRYVISFSLLIHNLYF